MNNLKRFLALVLAMSMMLTVVPFGAFAAESTAAPDSEEEALADDGTAATALTLGTKPTDGEVTGQPFDTTVSKNYRIPGLVNHNGTLIASADARWDDEKDGGGMDLVVSRSANGNDWSYTFAGYLGDNGNVWNENSSTLMDPVIISDGTTLYLLADMFPAGYSISSSSTTNTFSDTAIGFDASGNLLLSGDSRSTYGYYLKDGKIYSTAGAEQSGYTVKGWYDLYYNDTYVTNLFFSDSPFQVRATSYICMSTSIDGVTWSDPTLLNVKPEGVAWMVLGPGSGLVTTDGYTAFTAYDGSGIYLIYGKDGQWNRVQTSAATNESSIIELNDGTIRAFVKRGGSNTIAYVDFTKTSSGYTAGNLVDTGVTNFSQCMVSSLHYSKTLDGKEVVLVCCPSKPNSDDWDGRFNGKIHMFTLNSSNDMTLVGSYALNDESKFFAYSNMAEMNDGTIAVLYEDDCISYSAGNYTGEASHITYANVDLENALNINFDVAQDAAEKDKFDVTVYVGETVTETIADAVYKECTTNPNTDIATVTAEAGIIVYGELLDTANSGTRITLADSEYTFTAVGDGTYYATIAKDGSTWYVKPYSRGHSVNSIALTLTFNENGSVYIKDATHYLYVNRNTLAWDRTGTLSGYETHVTFYLYGVGEDADSAIPGYKLITSADELTSGEGYLIAFYDANNQLYVMNPTTRTVAAYNQMAAVGIEEFTTVAITGKAAGTTTAEIGDTVYNITVYNKRDITLQVGESQTVVDETGNYEASYTGEGLNTDVATVTVNGHAASAAELVDINALSELESGASYVLVNKRSGNVLMTTTGYTSTWGTTCLKQSSEAASVNSDAWTLTIDGSNFYLRNGDGKYMTISGNSSNLTDEQNAISIHDYGNGTFGLVQNGQYLNDMGAEGQYAGGYSVQNDAGAPWYIKKIKSASSVSTEIIFKGVSIGNTSVAVGYTVYNITVDAVSRYISLTVGQSITDTIENASYSMADVEVEDSDTATIDKVETVVIPGTKELVAVTEIVSGKQYLLVNTSAGKTMTATTYSSGLQLSGTANTDNTNLWLIETSGDAYTVRYGTDGGYLTVGSGSASVSDSATTVKLQYYSDGDYWHIKDGTGTYGLNNYSGSGTYAAGWSGSDNGSKWMLYEVVTTPAETDTIVTFTGHTVGQTTATVGNVTYNITVSEDVRDINLHVGQTQTFYIDGYSYDTGSIVDSTIATLDSVVPGNAKLVSVSEIVSEAQYLIVNAQTGEVLTDTAITLTGDAGERDALETTGTASVSNTELWTITGSAENGYTLTQGDKYLVISDYYAAMSSTATNLKLSYSNSGWMICDDTTWNSLQHNEGDYYLCNGIAAADYTTDALGSSITTSYSYWRIYKIDKIPVTEVTFTGVKADTTTATVGHVTFNIIVDNVTEGDISEFNNIVGVDSYSDDNSNATYRSDLDMAGKVITSLRITEGATFHLGVDVTGYESVTWTTTDSDTATVDSAGNVTAVAVGKTFVTATVVKDGVEESISIPVTVVPSLVENTTNITTIFYYIDQVDYTDPYYTMFLSTENASGPAADHEMVMVSEGEVIWLERPTDSAFAWIWTADPWEGYALTLMSATGSRGEHYPLKNTDGELGSGTVGDNVYYKGCTAYNNVISVGTADGANWATALDELLEEAILVGVNVYPNYGCDSAMSMTRSKGDGVPKVVTSMTFISDPMPQIQKTVNGVLPTTRKRADFKPYTPGMVATVGEYVYFQITVTLERPTVWEDVGAGIGAITYTDAIVSDTVLDGAYFYVQANDTNLDGVISGSEVTTGQTEDITTRLNAAWKDDETVRTINLYLIYEIQNGDISKFVIDNTANLSWQYSSEYSTGTLAGKADAEASITVVGYAMDNVVIDFGQSFTYTGLTDAHLQYVSLGEHQTKYGTAVVAGVGEKQDDGLNTYYTEYTVTYTPTAILQEPDAVQLSGTYIDTESGETVSRVINGFLVYPATTVYYEEGFMFNEASTNWSAGAKATREQTFELLSKSVYSDKTLTGFESNKQHAYGYDPIYAENTGASNDTQSTASITGAATTFTFTGTGFDLYANCTEETGSVAVQVRDTSGKAVRMYTVDTKVGEEQTDTGDATDGQTGSMYSLPIISEQGLPHGTYTVKIVKIMEGTVNLDGIRIFNTFDESPYQEESSKAESPFNIDLEDNPEFYQLRDYVLSALNVSDTTSADYGKLEDMAEQVYAGISSDSEAPDAAVLAKGSYNSDVQNLLDNGPKNELYLHAGETLVFSVNTSRAMQIGLKAPAGETGYSITGATADGISGTLKSTVDMFYALGNTIGTETTYAITITNTGSNILAVTDLKICDDPNAALVPLAVADIKSALVTMGYGVAENTTTGASYDSVSEALNAAREGETVALLADCTESNLMVTAGVTLDLNGFSLTASYVVAFDSAHIIDSVGTGCLVTSGKNLVLDEENAMIPIYNGTGYVFTKAGFSIRQDTAYTGAGIKINALACPVQMAVVDLLKDGGADNNIEIVIRLSWDTDQGTGSQEFRFTDEIVASVYSSNNGTWSSYGKMFGMTVTGFESITNLKANVVIKSGTNVEYISSISLAITE